MIVWLGTGLLGANFTRNLLKRGESVTVWNRTAERAKALEAEGAKAVTDPAEAVRGASRIHLTLSDDRAVDDVLEQARDGIGKDAIIVDHTTTSVHGTAERVARWDARGITFVHAPVFMGPQNALESTGIMLISGEPQRVARISPDLEKLTGKLVNLGPHADRAAAFKLMGNLFMMFMTMGVVEMITFAKSVGISPQDAVSLFDMFNPGASLPQRAQRVLQADYEHPSWELKMARKDARLMDEETRRAGIPLHVLPAIGHRMDELIERGFGGDDWTVIAKDALEPVKA